MNAESTYVEGPKLRYAWLWWVIGYVLVAWTINDSLEAHPPDFGPITSDKVLHFTGYFLLTTWFGGVARSSRYWLVGLGLAALGGSMEILQGLMHNGRTADWLDMLANTLGICSGLLVAWLGLGRWMIWVERLLGLQK
jgi:VanZ family protein